MLIAWVSAGRPDCGKRGLTWTPARRCGCCGRRDDGVRDAALMSANYSGWDTLLPDKDHLRWVCRSCAWAFRNPTLRRQPHILTPEGATAVSCTVVRQLLLGGPIPGDMAISMPVGGQRLTVPYAAWGRLVSDYGQVSWSSVLTGALAAVTRLKTIGAGEKLLLTSRHLHLANVDPLIQLEASVLWDGLARWRSDKAMWPLLVRLTRD